MSSSSTTTVIHTAGLKALERQQKQGKQEGDALRVHEFDWVGEGSAINHDRCSESLRQGIESTDSNSYRSTGQGPESTSYSSMRMDIPTAGHSLTVD